MRRADSIEYILEEEKRGSVDKAVSSVFVNRRFTPVPSSDLQMNSGGKLKISQILNDFKSSSDLSDESKALVMDAAVRSEADYFATGTVTVNARSVNHSTGRVRIGVTLEAQIFGFRKSKSGDRYIGTKIVASTGSRVSVAEGSDQSEAETKAIEDASILAANVLCDQLRDSAAR